VSVPALSPRATPSLEGRRGARALHEAREHDRAGRPADARAAFEAAVREAEAAGEAVVLAEALRRLGVLLQRQRDGEEARRLCERSREVADRAGDAVLAAEALNSLGIFDLETGRIDEARARFERALALAGGDARLRGHVEQNLGIVANIRGDLGAALAHYARSLAAFEAAGDERGRMIAYHNLGMVTADQQMWDAADEYFRLCLAVAERLGDIQIRGHALMNRSEVLIARQRYDEARAGVQEALRIFDRTGVVRSKADAYKTLGVIHRDTGRPVLAEERLRQAIELAASCEYVLAEAEASRELAQLYREQGRNQDALRLLNAAHRHFRRLDARIDLVDVGKATADLEGTYLSIVRDWGRSIETADSYTHGHCERVAQYAVAIARALGLSEEETTTIRIGAYLHDLGKVKVPDEILNKPGRLTPEEFEVMKMHPVYGVEMLEGIDFPWDILPMIRWHHEKYDGTGYPDRLRGDEIPLSAQVLCAADVLDALTSTRSYRSAMTLDEAMREMRATRHYWRADVFAALERAVAGLAERRAA
jgi:putative nucleotidyltransferase with HDIG domain